MSSPFFVRLRRYYMSVGAVLRGEAEAASVFANTTDIGLSRERTYVEFLRQHAPKKCNVFLGGFVFGWEGEESSQLDVIVTSDAAPRFDLNNKDGNGKSFSPVDGTLAVVSIKSLLDKTQLEDSLASFASVPPTSSIENRVISGLEIVGYDNWPYKVIYATSGLKCETLLRHIEDFYEVHKEIPLSRRPDLIHVSGQFVILKADRALGVWNPNTKEPLNKSRFVWSDGDNNVGCCIV